MRVVSVTSHGTRLKHLNEWVALNVEVFKNFFDEIDINLAESDYDNFKLENDHDGFVKVFKVDIDLRSHNKYYHTFKRHQFADIFICDDDMVFDDKYIDNIIQNREGHITSSRCTDRFRVGDFTLVYNHTGNNKFHYAHGSNGILYPCGTYDVNNFDVEEIKKFIRDDDLMLHLVRLRRHQEVRNVFQYKKPSSVPYFCEVQSDSITADMASFWTQYFDLAKDEITKLYKEW